MHAAHHIRYFLEFIQTALERLHGSRTCRISDRKSLDDWRMAGPFPDHPSRQHIWTYRCLGNRTSLELGAGKYICSTHDRTDLIHIAPCHACIDKCNNQRVTRQGPLPEVESKHQAEKAMNRFGSNSHMFAMPLPTNHTEYKLGPTVG